jgi:hypothetical protein
MISCAVVISTTITSGVGFALFILVFWFSDLWISGLLLLLLLIQLHTSSLAWPFWIQFYYWIAGLLLLPPLLLPRLLPPWGGHFGTSSTTTELRCCC